MKFKSFYILLKLMCLVIITGFTSKIIHETSTNTTHMDLGTFSISLTVKDIATSKAYYEKLGFEALEGAGSVKDKWLIMVNDGINIGLFQDMFPKNTITFNPKNAREIHQTLSEAGVEILSASAIENESGPCHFTMQDPDGNPILVDQHF